MSSRDKKSKAAAKARKKPARRARPLKPARPKAKPAAPKAKSKAARKPPRAAAPPKAKPAKSGVAKPTAQSARAKPTPAAPAAPEAPKPRAPGRSSRKSTRRSALSLRRGPNGELLQPGDLLLPGGPQDGDEIQYLLRGAIASEHPSMEVAVTEVVVKRNTGDAERPEVTRLADVLGRRFESSIEPLLPARLQIRRNFQGVVDRARHRRREIGAFLRGLDLGATESSHMDSHGEDSLQKLMEWSARLERLSEADEPAQADYGQFHRVLDQLESNTEALIVDVEATLRRLRDRGRAS